MTKTLLKKTYYFILNIHTHAVFIVVSTETFRTTFLCEQCTSPYVQFCNFRQIFTQIYPRFSLQRAVRGRCVKLITNAGSISHFQFMIWCNYRVSPQFDTSQNHTYAFTLSYNKQIPLIKSVSMRIRWKCFRRERNRD